MSADYRMVRTDWVKSDPNQPRRTFDDEAIEGMAESIRSSGVIEPVIVRSDGTLLNGERRWRAAKLAGLEEIPAIVKWDLDEVSAMEVQAIEATQDEEVPTLERYDFWLRLYEKERERNPTYRVSDLARLLGVSETTIRNGFKAVGAPEAMKEMVRRGELGASLLPIIDASNLDEEERVKLASKIASGVITTTGVTLQSELMPLIRTAPDQVREKLINEPEYGLVDAHREVDHLRRVDAAREALSRGETVSEPPMSLGEFLLKLEQKVTDLARVLREAAESGAAANAADWMWRDLARALEGLAAAVDNLRSSRTVEAPLAGLPQIEGPEAPS